MSERYDALTARESNGKSYFTKLGAMFPNKSGEGFTLVLDAVPASVDGQYRIILKVPQPRDNQSGGQQGNQQRQQGGNGGWTGQAPADDYDQDAPF
jgi:hypothetical protein